MIEVTSFLLKHLYELMADEYDVRSQSDGANIGHLLEAEHPPGTHGQPASSEGSRLAELTDALITVGSERGASRSSSSSRREQETNEQIVSFLAHNQLPDLICETFIELLFVSVFLAISWIFVMIVQLHCQQLEQPARMFYCNTKFLASLMYCNSRSAFEFAS